MGALLKLPFLPSILNKNFLLIYTWLFIAGLLLINWIKFGRRLSSDTDFIDITKIYEGYIPRIQKAGSNQPPALSLTWEFLFYKIAPSVRFRFSEVCPIAILLPEIFILIVARDQNLLLRCQNDLSRYHQPDYIVFSLLPLIAGRQSAVDRQSCRRDGLDFLGCEEPSSPTVSGLYIFPVSTRDYL